MAMSVLCQYAVAVFLGASLKHHIERPRSCPSNPSKPAVSNDLGELRLTRLRARYQPMEEPMEPTSRRHVRSFNAIRIRRLLRASCPLSSSAGDLSMAGCAALALSRRNIAQPMQSSRPLAAFRHSHRDYSPGCSRSVAQRTMAYFDRLMKNHSKAREGDARDAPRSGRKSLSSARENHFALPDLVRMNCSSKKHRHSHGGPARRNRHAVSHKSPPP
jgi:hypothetical protein